MHDLTHRSGQSELLDDDSIPFDAIRQNMQELNVINRLLGGHAITISGLKKLLAGSIRREVITICEIGCGGGDNLKAIDAWCQRSSLAAKFIGIDIKDTCIEYAKVQYPSMEVTWVVADYREVSFSETRPDIIFSSLFCHHFSDAALPGMLQWMKQHCTIGFFINDLHRHLLAYYAIKWITSIFSRSYLVKNDAPLSVARGFTKAEWKKIIGEAGFVHCTIEWKWAFRHLIVYKPTMTTF